MKTLPDNPDLGHLKQQAKDLLAGLRDSDPATSLATAQKALAAQYGFRTWTDLKAEVDRTGGRAAIAGPALAQAIADRYDLGAVTGPMRSLARPDESGRAWSLETDRGRWVARTMDTWWPIVDVETRWRCRRRPRRPVCCSPRRCATGTAGSSPRSTGTNGASACGRTPGHRWRRPRAPPSPGRWGRSSRPSTGWPCRSTA
ncbi:hypothetical protein JCM33774_44170 [Actinophytocola sp. KF-1]